MKKIIFAGAGAVAAAMLSGSAFAQDADVQMNGASGAAAPMGSSMETTGSTSGDVAPGGAMGAGAASATSDTTGSYTIVTRTSADAQGTSSGQDANRNTDSTSIQKTIDANPGLAEKLRAEGIEVSNIGAISVKPNGEVTVFNKG